MYNKGTDLAAQAGLLLFCLQILKTGFLASGLILLAENKWAAFLKEKSGSHFSAKTKFQFFPHFMIKLENHININRERIFTLNNLLRSLYLTLLLKI